MKIRSSLVGLCSVALASSALGIGFASTAANAVTCTQKHIVVAGRTLTKFTCPGTPSGTGVYGQVTNGVPGDEIFLEYGGADSYFATIPSGYTPPRSSATTGEKYVAPGTDWGVSVCIYVNNNPLAGTCMS
jgi:hypothetical protein